MKRIIGILMTILFMISCVNSKESEIENPNGIWTQPELVELNSLVSEFDQILISEYKSESITKAYVEFSNSALNDMAIPDLIGYDKINSVAKNLKIFNKIWEKHADSITNKNHFSLKYNSNYQKYLKGVGENSEMIKDYADKYEYTGDIAPSVVGFLLQNIEKFDLNNKTTRLILTIHYITLINR